jgi:hypothetical protein
MISEATVERESLGKTALFLEMVQIQSYIDRHQLKTTIPQSDIWWYNDT